LLSTSTKENKLKKSSEKPQISEVNQVENKTDSSLNLIASTDNIVVSKQEQATELLNKPVPSSEKRILQSQNKTKLDKIVNSIKENYFNPFRKIVLVTNLS